MDKMREDFEVWASDNGASPRAIQRGADGGYLLMSISSAWEAWQASRKSLVVDLSDIHLLACDQDDVTKALRAAGITVKG